MWWPSPVRQRHDTRSIYGWSTRHPSHSVTSQCCPSRTGAHPHPIRFSGPQPVHTALPLTSHDQLSGYSRIRARDRHCCGHIVTALRAAAHGLVHGAMAAPDRRPEGLLLKGPAFTASRSPRGADHGANWCLPTPSLLPVLNGSELEQHVAGHARTARAIPKPCVAGSIPAGGHQTCAQPPRSARFRQGEDARAGLNHLRPTTDTWP